MLQEMYVLSPPGVENASFGRGYSSLRSNQLAYSVGAHAMIQQGGISLVFVREIILLIMMMLWKVTKLRPLE